MLLHNLPKGNENHTKASVVMTILKNSNLCFSKQQKLASEHRIWLNLVIFAAFFWGEKNSIIQSIEEKIIRTRINNWFSLVVAFFAIFNKPHGRVTLTGMLQWKQIDAQWSKHKERMLVHSDELLWGKSRRINCDANPESCFTVTVIEVANFPLPREIEPVTRDKSESDWKASSLLLKGREN